MGQRVAAELIAQLHDGRTHPLQSHVPCAELSQHPRLDLSPQVTAPGRCLSRVRVDEDLHRGRGRG